MLHFFLSPKQAIAILAYLDGFYQVQALWLRETRQDGLSAPRNVFGLYTVLKNIIVHGEVAFDAPLHISPVLSKEKNVC